jgi:pyridoxine/pyridoxamine 5'-phosphate oxidase
LTLQISSADLDSNPFVQFKIWMEQALDSELTLPNAMSLATSDESGVGIRTVLLKTFDEQGFVFFTNYNSKKSKQINNNPTVALLFPWLDLERQGACSIQILNCTKGLLSKSALEIPLLVNSRLNLIKSTFIINCFCQTL